MGQQSKFNGKRYVVLRLITFHSQDEYTTCIVNEITHRVSDDANEPDPSSAVEVNISEVTQILMIDVRNIIFDKHPHKDNVTKPQSALARPEYRAELIF